MIPGSTAPGPVEWVFASSNRGKLDEARALLATCGITLLRSQTELGIETPEESGGTFVENALLKARHAAGASGRPAIADDSGLCVDALGGAPGLVSARYAGSGASDRANIDRLLGALAEVPESQRSAHFVCVVVALVSASDPDPVIGTGHWHGVIATRPSGQGGFGYDPVFVVPELGCTAAELDSARKRALSHRGRALAALRDGLLRRRAPGP